MPFERFAAAFRESHGLPAEGDVDLQQVLDQQYLRLRLGELDVRWPAAWAEHAGKALDPRKFLQSLLDVGVTWTQWKHPGSEQAEAAAKSAAVVRRWIGATTLPQLARAAHEGGGDLLDRLDPPDEVRQAVADLAAASVDAPPAQREASNGGDPAPEPPPPAMVVLSPTREHFLEMLSFVGSLRDDLRANFWQSNVPVRLQTWVYAPVEFQLVALEYAAPGREPGDFTTALPMDNRERTGLEQHVAERGGASLVRRDLGEELDPDFASGLAQDLVVTVCGEDNARIGGDERGKSRGGLGGFVHGGRSAGGGMLGLNLDSRWRATKGQQHFVRELRRGLRDGRKAAPTAPAAFVVKDDEAKDSHTVEAPLLGIPPAERQPLANEFVPDYKELHRAYRTAFVFWLRELAGKTPADSHEKFGALLRELQQRKGQPAGIDAACDEVYGVPLSTLSPDDHGLEWQFLAWLGKGS